MKRLIVLLLLVTSPAFAQQQSTPAEFALQASSMIAQLGQLAESQKKQIEAQQAQIVLLQKQLEEAKKPANDKQ